MDVRVGGDTGEAGVFDVIGTAGDEDNDRACVCEPCGTHTQKEENEEYAIERDEKEIVAAVQESEFCSESFAASAMRIAENRMQVGNGAREFEGDDRLIGGIEIAAHAHGRLEGAEDHDGEKEECGSEADANCGFVGDGHFAPWCLHQHYHGECANFTSPYAGRSVARIGATTGGARW